MADPQALVWLITGANRGIDYEFVKQLLSDTSSLVVATARDPSRADALQRLAEGSSRLLLVPLEVTDEDSAQEAARLVQQRHGRVDYLISNAGIARVSLDGPEGRLYGVPQGDKAAEPISSVETIFRVNTIGSIIVLRAFLPLLQNGTRKTVVHISSGASNISMHAKAAASPEPASPMVTSGLGYAVSKAALNMVSACIGAQLKDDGFIVISMRPGRVDTDMVRAGGPVPGMPPPISPEESVSKQLQVIRSLTAADNGSFKTYQGNDSNF